MADGVEEAGAEEFFAGVFLEDFEMAGAEFEDALEMLDGIFEGGGGGEGAGAFGAGGGGLAGDEDAGVIVAGGDFEIGVGFVVEEAGVEAGLDVFNEAVFDEEGFDFGIGGEGVEVGDEFEEELLAVGAEIGGGDEVGADAVAEVAGFTDVDDDATGVFHEVDAGRGGEGFGFFAEAWEAGGSGFIGAREGDFVVAFFDDGFVVEAGGGVIVAEGGEHGERLVGGEEFVENFGIGDGSGVVFGHRIDYSGGAEGLEACGLRAGLEAWGRRSFEVEGEEDE